MQVYFEVEVGTGSPTANSYVSVDHADNYILMNYDDNSDWEDLDEDKKQLRLIRASKFFDKMLRWNSKLLTDTQGLSWPRESFQDREGRIVTGITNVIKDAVSALAYSSLQDDLSLESDKLISEKFGDTIDTYSTPKVIGNDTVMTLIKDLTFLKYGGNRVTIVEAVRA